MWFSLTAIIDTSLETLGAEALIENAGMVVLPNPSCEALLILLREDLKNDDGLNEELPAETD